VIFSRLLAVTIASSALVCCAGASLVSLVFAVYDLLISHMTAPFAVASLCFALAVLVGGAASVAVLALRPPISRVVAVTGSPALDRALAFVRDRPVASLIGLVGGVVLTALQPKLVAAVARDLLLRRSSPRRGG
jgi:hypothetical protein